MKLRKHKKYFVYWHLAQTPKAFKERMATQVTLECGHVSMLRVRTTPEKKDIKARADEAAEKEKQKLCEKKSSYSNSSPFNPLATLLAEMSEEDSSDSEEIVAPVLSSKKTKKEQSKSARGEEREVRKRKRKLESIQDEVVVKRKKDRDSSLSPFIEPVSSSQSPISVDVDSCYSTKENASSHKENHNITGNEQVAPDWTNSAFVDPEAEATFADALSRVRYEHEADKWKLRKITVEEPMPVWRSWLGMLRQTASHRLAMTVARKFEARAKGRQQENNTNDEELAIITDENIRQWYPGQSLGL